MYGSHACGNMNVMLPMRFVGRRSTASVGVLNAPDQPLAVEWTTVVCGSLDPGASSRDYWHVTLKLSAKAVTSPFALIVKWKVSCTFKLLLGPWPIM